MWGCAAILPVRARRSSGLQLAHQRALRAESDQGLARVFSARRLQPVVIPFAENLPVVVVQQHVMVSAEQDTRWGKLSIRP